jgi:iron complex transport system ATP-binding protein
MDIDVKKGTVTAILGANGVGKTTLLYILLGLYLPDHGDLVFFKKTGTRFSTGATRQFIGMVSQNDTVPFDLSAEEYVLLGRAPHLGLLSMPKTSDRAIAQKALDTVGMTHMATRVVNHLSSGEKQLIHIARILAQESEILLLDEPCSHLDLINSRRILTVIKTIAERGGTVVFTTHDPNAAAAVADQIMLLKKGELVAYGGVEETITAARLTKTYGDTVEVVDTGHGIFVKTI